MWSLAFRLMTSWKGQAVACPDPCGGTAAEADTQVTGSMKSSAKFHEWSPFWFLGMGNFFSTSSLLVSRSKFDGDVSCIPRFWHPHTQAEKAYIFVSPLHATSKLGGFKTIVCLEIRIKSNMIVRDLLK
ncbi:unnamed protein product [Ixodes pacificus]